MARASSRARRGAAGGAAMSRRRHALKIDHRYEEVECSCGWNDAPSRSSRYGKDVNRHIAAIVREAFEEGRRAALPAAPEGGTA